MLTREHSDQSSIVPGRGSIVRRPLLARLRRGGTVGLLIGGVVALIEAAIANWDAGLAFNEFAPPGTPLGATLALTVLVPTLAGAIGGALAPLFHTRRGAILAGLLTVAPLLAAAAVFLPQDNGAPLWQQVLLGAGGLALAAIIALDLRPMVLDSEPDAAEQDPDPPHD